MKFVGANGRVYNVNIAPYLIDWSRKVSVPQFKVKSFLKKYWDSKVVLEEFRLPGTRLRADLMNVTNKVAVEVSPKSSHSFNKFFHKNRVNFSSAMGREIDKVKWMEANGYTLVEVFDEDFDKLSPEWFKEKYDVDL